MTDVPERIFIKECHPKSNDLDWYVWSDGIEYIRADASPEVVATMPVAQVLIAGAIEAAAMHLMSEARRWSEGLEATAALQFLGGIADEIRALTPADAIAAVQAMVDAAEKRGADRERERVAKSMLIRADQIEAFTDDEYGDPRKYAAGALRGHAATIRGEQG